MPTVVIIEDESDIAELIAFNLEKEGYQAILCSDGMEGFHQATQMVPDLVVLDLMLPGMPGTEICKLLKGNRKTARIPVIMLTARGEEIDRVVGFEVGADDYLVKPFSMRELLLRMKALLRRTSAPTEPDSLLVAGAVTMDTVRHVVLVDGAEVSLTSTEFKLLHVLMSRPGRVQSRDTLLRDVWGYLYVEDSRTVDTHITRVRTKLGEAGSLIKTVRGFGYKIESV